MRGRRASPAAGSPDALLAAAGQGDERAFSAFFDLTIPLIFPLLHRGLGDRNRASDAAERIYVRVWRAAPRFRPERECAYARLLAATRLELST
jgi:RNA polymerase sigma-70 factor (ECF subfamily)